MKRAKTKILISFVLLVLAVCGWQLSNLYFATQPAFKKLKSEFPKSRDIYASEVYISELLFDDLKTTQMKPANFLARKTLEFDSEAGMAVHHLKRRWLSKRIERNFEPDDLLIHWLSTVYFGNGEYGLETVSQSLFGKSSQYLSKEEALKIAALIQAPSRYRNDIALWKKRQNVLLKNLEDASIIQ